MSDFDRPIMVFVCKDGTISYGPRGEPPFNGAALPVFSVNTEEEAEDLQVLFGAKQYVSHELMPGRPWYRIAGFSGNVEDLDYVTVKFREAWERNRG